MSEALDATAVKVATELIDFQRSDDFGPQLEQIISAIINKIKDNTFKKDIDIQTSKELAELKKLIFNRLGIKTKIITNQALAAIMPFYSNKHHILLHEFWHGAEIDDQDLLLHKSKDEKGTVDLVNAKLGGIFSQHEHQLYLHFKDLVDYELTAAEITAITLHELGHAFYACEYSNRLESANQVLQDIAKLITAKDKQKDLVYIYRELKKVNDSVTEEDVEKLVSGGGIIPGHYWFKTLIGTVQTQLGNKKYDESSFEQMADNFSARFGYGHALVSSLGKITLEVSKGLMLFAMFGEIYYFCILLIGFFVVPVILTKIYFAIVIILTMVMQGEDARDYTYDSIKMRYQRIRNEQIAFLKQSNLSKEEMAHVIETIQGMDKTIESVFEYKSIFNTIANFILPFHRRAKNSIEEQQLLERLATNDLFLSAAKFKVLANN